MTVARRVMTELGQPNEKSKTAGMPARVVDPVKGYRSTSGMGKKPKKNSRKRGY